MEKIEILFGFSNPTYEEGLKKKLMSLNHEAHIASRVSKATILDYVKENPNCNTVVLMERLSGGGKYTAEEVAKLTDERDVNVIILLSARHMGTEYVKTLYAAGITGAMFLSGGKEKGIHVNDMARMILHRRSRADAREYYGISTQTLDLGSIDNNTYTNYYRDLKTGDGNIIENYLVICGNLTPMQIADFTKRLPSDDIDELVQYDEFHTVLGLLKEYGHDLKIKRPKKTVLGVKKPLELTAGKERIIISVEEEEKAFSSALTEDVRGEKRQAEEDLSEGLSLTDLFGMLDSGKSIHDVEKKPTQEQKVVEKEDAPEGLGGNLFDGVVFEEEPAPEPVKEVISEEKPQKQEEPTKKESFSKKKETEGLKTEPKMAKSEESATGKPKKGPKKEVVEEETLTTEERKAHDESIRKIIRKSKTHDSYDEEEENRYSYYSYEDDGDDEYDNITLSYEDSHFPVGVVITVSVLLLGILGMIFFPDLKALVGNL